MDPKTSEYSLSWEGHIQHVRKALSRLLQTNELCDVTLYAEGQKIGAHKVLLSACSKYFDELFKDFKDERPVVVLKGVRFNILKHILNFVYNGETNVELEQLNQFLEAAAFLKIDGLTENNLKRKRNSSLASEFDNTTIEHEQTFMDIVEKSGQRYLSGKISRDFFENSSPKSPKLLKIDNSPTKNQEASSKVKQPDFTTAPQIRKYSIDTPTRVGEWLSDYEFNTQSSVPESHSPLHENTDDKHLREDRDDPLLQEKIDKHDTIPSKFKITNIKFEPTNEPEDSDVEEIFDQNDFANCLDAEIDISDDGNDDLQKQLMKTALAAIDEKGLYLCKICNKSYAKKDSLKKHFAVHVDNTTCTICDKVLSRKSHLIRHLKVHGISLK